MKKPLFLDSVCHLALLLLVSCYSFYSNTYLIMGGVSALSLIYFVAVKFKIRRDQKRRDYEILISYC
jgi:hypothetical protein